jgi:hypothetical protein
MNFRRLSKRPFSRVNVSSAFLCTGVDSKVDLLAQDTQASMPRRTAESLAHFSESDAGFTVTMLSMYPIHILHSFSPEYQYGCGYWGRVVNNPTDVPSYSPVAHLLHKRVDCTSISSY